MKFIEFREITKYIISVSCGFIIDILILYILTDKIGIYYLTSAYIAIAFGFTANYTINIKWVFKHRRYKDTPIQEYVIMSLISFCTAIINIFIIWIATEFLYKHYMLSKILASGITFILKYLLRKNILFRTL